MKYNQNKVDAMTLALLYLVTTENEFGTRAGRTFDSALRSRRHCLWSILGQSESWIGK